MLGMLLLSIGDIYQYVYVHGNMVSVMRSYLSFEVKVKQGPGHGLLGRVLFRDVEKWIGF